MRWPKPRDSLHTSRSIRSIVSRANLRQLSLVDPPSNLAASRYAETNIAFHDTYIVLSTNGVGRGRRAASIFPFAFAIMRRTDVSSRLSCLATSTALRAIHKTFFAGL